MFMLRWCLNLLIGIGEFTFITSAQIYTNLVNNPSFEDTILYYCINSSIYPPYTACPESRVDFCKARYWYPAFPYCGNSPDYYNACNNYLPPPFQATAGVPKSEIGFQYARTGQAYAGVAMWSSGSTYSLPGIQYYEGWNEYIGNTLKEPLKKDHLYCITFYINRANGAGYAINKVGAYLSPDSIVHPPIDCYAFPPPDVFIELTPTFEDTTLVTDTLNWVPLFKVLLLLQEVKST
ncbi:MAG: hypothetical protein KatS3mg028_1124 [Bacteroidia bacterium]|nr:MAG: hypothetical protein KatS3mg028_1124 [Bacteroidia bacterium]